MAIILILVPFFSIFIILYCRESAQGDRFRVSFLKTSLVQGCLIAISTEGLSLTQSLDFNHVVLFWLFTSIVSFTVIYFTCQQNSVKTKVRNLGKNWQRFSFFDRLCVGIVTTILAISLITSLIAPPNNWDSMTYHMPRVVHWIQNQTVAHYPTHNLRQISLPPGAAFFVTHLQILSGDDRFANCVQWFAFLGSILGISLITKQLAGERSQSISLLLCASIPMAIAQSTTTQTDLVVSFWLICVTYFLFNANADSRSSLMWAGVAASLAVLTKPTALVFGIPLLIVFSLNLFIDIFNTSGLFKAIYKTFCAGLTIALSSVVLSLPTFVRNYQAFGAFLGPDLNTRNEIYGLAPLISNVLKNLSLNFLLPGLPQFIAFIHQPLLGIDVNDPRLSFATTNFFMGGISELARLLVPLEEKVASPIHWILGIVAGLYLCFSHFSRNGQKRRKMLLLQVAIVSGFLMFCYLLKWQVWGSRLLLPLTILQTPITAYFLENCSSKVVSQWRSKLLVVLTVIAVFYALTPVRHPIISLSGVLAKFSNDPSPSILRLDRQAIYFSGSRKELAIPYSDAVNQAVDRYQCRNVGFIASEDDWEYPLWVLLKNKTSGSFRFKHIQVQNESNSLKPEFPDSEVCAVISSNGKTLQIRQRN